MRLPKIRLLEVVLGRFDCEIFGPEVQSILLDVDRYHIRCCHTDQSPCYELALVDALYGSIPICA